MVKKLMIFASLGILLVLLTLNSATGAWFTDSKASSKNLFQTGILNIEGPGAMTSGINVDNIYPGWQSGDEPKSITIINSGTLDFDYSISCEPLDGNLLYNGPTPIQVNINESGFVNINELDSVFLGSINRNSTGTFTIRFRLPETADNLYSEQTAAFIFRFDALQKIKAVEVPPKDNTDDNSGENNLQPVYNSNKNQYYSEIQKAIEDAAANDRINVSAGTYSENISIDKPLILQGPNINIHPQYDKRKPEAIIKGSFILKSDNITIEGFEITNPGSGDYFGIRGNAAGSTYNNIVIRYNNFHDIGSNAIRYGAGYGGGTYTKNWNISNNLITRITGDNAEAIKLYNIAGLVLDRNYIRHIDGSKVRSGILLEGVSNAVIDNNDISLGSNDVSAAPYIIQIGIASHQQTIDNFKIRNNKFSEANRGIITVNKGNLKELYIEGNTFKHIGTDIIIHSGATSGKVSNINISGNSFEDSTSALSFASSSSYSTVKVKENKFSNISTSYIYTPNSHAFSQGNIDASLNWWGTSIKNEIENKMGKYVTFSPWYTDSSMSSYQEQ